MRGLLRLVAATRALRLAVERVVVVLDETGAAEVAEVASTTCWWRNEIELKEEVDADLVAAASEWLSSLMLKFIDCK